ncbi:Clr5 domain containing protein [Rhypophila sp. PSN 637]
MTKQWNEYREVIIGQYKHQNRPLHEVQRIMEEKYKFKASTRAYRSRFDRWKVYKYSCRKRRDSIAHSEKTSNSGGEPTASSPGEDSPGSSPMVSPVLTSDDMFASSMCAEAASHEVLGRYVESPSPPSTEPIADPSCPFSPVTKFESRSRYEGITAPIHSVASLPSPRGSFGHESSFSFHFDQGHYLGSQISNETTGGSEYYRLGHERNHHHNHHHEHLYHSDPQSPILSSAEHIRGLSLDGSSTTQRTFPPLHPPTTMGYNYPVDFLKAPRD